MDNCKKRIILDAFREGYQDTGKAGKGKKLDEVCSILRYHHRKSGIRAINRASQKASKSRGRQKKYSEISMYHLRKLWLKTDQMCAKKLVVALPVWLRHYTECSESVKQEIQQMSASTIDRYLKSYRVLHKRRLRSGTRPGSIQLKNRIPIKPLGYRVEECGHIEADTVAHCGDCMSGTFAWSLTLVDKKTGWTEVTAMWGKGSKGVIEGIEISKKRMPFDIKYFFCDNGSEFLNYHLVNYFSSYSGEEKRSILHRGRPYKKNDQCHVEQKNWTHVRQIMGYGRIGKAEAVVLMNDIYFICGKLQNFFVPQLKLKAKVRIGSKWKKEYDDPKTPYERVMSESGIPMETKHKLRKEFESLNPFQLQEELQRKMDHLFKFLEKQTIRKAS